MGLAEADVQLPTSARGCSVGHWRHKLDDADRAVFDGWVKQMVHDRETRGANAPGGVTAIWISTQIAEHDGARLQPQTIRRHVNGGCTCGDAKWD